MANSPNKGYTLQAVGANAGTWGTELNDSMISIVDRNLGGILTKNISVTGDVTLTNITPTWEAQQSTLILTGNPAYVTYPTITISTPAVGFLFVQNAITLNGAAYPEIRIKNSSNATYCVVPANSSAVIILDTTNGARLAGQQGFASGTSLTFTQTAAPTGWTKSTTHDNKALRIVNSAGGISGGTTGFTSVFTNRTISQANLPNISLSGTAASKSLTGVLTYISQTWNNYGTATGVFSKSTGFSGGSTPTSVDFSNAGRIGFDGTHDHTVSVSLGGSGTTMDFDVQYVDAIICTKD